MTTIDHLIRADEFTPAALLSLARGDIDLIWHREFYSVYDCEAVLPAIVDECEAAHYTLTTDLQSLGTSIGEATESAANTERYLATAAETTSLIRHRIFDGRTSPGDAIRLLADEWWPGGAMVGRSGGRQMLPGIIRRWPTGGHANPHIDQRSIPLLEPYALRRRLGVNVYLEVPPAGSGGEIEFWHMFEDETEYVSIRRPDYGLDRESLGEPLAAILPGQGDLVVFNAARLHGVRAVDSGSRVTAACFLGVRTADQPIVVFA
jgi:2OG-Fe(II) oxygenase superfamily